jgi:hypothetical protein
MSLWTPDGERPVPPANAQQAAPPATEMPDGEQPLTPEQEEQARAMAHELAEARARLLETEVAAVLTNHAMGIYELAAIHLTADQPKFDEARLAIDALAGLLSAVEGRIGDDEPTLREAVQGLQMAFVQRSSAEAAAGNAAEG